MGCSTYNEIIEQIKPYLRGESQEDIDAAIAAAREAELGDRIDAHEDTKQWVLNMLNTAGPRLNKAKVELVDIMQAKDGFKISYKYPKTDKIYTTNTSRVSPFVYDKATINVDEQGLLDLFSDREFVNQGRTGYEQVAVDIVNDADKMLKLAEELQSEETVETSEWHKTELMARLNVLATGLREVLPKVNVWLNKEAERNGGIMQVNGDHVDVYVSKGIGNRHMTALEAYVHEMWHAATKYAVDSGDATISAQMRLIRQIKNDFIANTTAEDLAQHMREPDVKYAQSVIDYFASDVGIHEFVAYSQTNEAVMKRLQSMRVGKIEEEHPNLASKLVAYLRKLLDLVLARVDKVPNNVDGYTAMQQLVVGIAKANNRALEVKRETVIQHLLKPFVQVEQRIVDYAKQVQKQVENTPMPKRKNDGTWESAKYITKMIARSFVDKRAKDIVNLTAGLAGLKPEGSIMTILRDMSESDDTQDLAERLGLISQNIDQQRNYVFSQVALSLKGGFDRELTDGEMNAITSVLLDTDFGAMYYEYNLQELLEDENKIDAQVQVQVAKLVEMGIEPSQINYYKAMTEGLAHYMITGQANSVQLLNAYSIANMVGSHRKLEQAASDELVNIVDKMASLQALKKVDAADKEIMHALLVTQPNGVENFVAYQVAQKEQAEEQLFSTKADKLRQIKGYSKEIFSKDVDMQVAPLADERKMKAMGYKLVKKLGKHKADGTAGEKGMYVSSVQVRPDVLRVSLRITDKGRRGTTLTESYLQGSEAHIKDKVKRDVARIKVDGERILQDMEAGKYKAKKEDFGLVPVLDNSGNIVDYRYMMNKEDKINVLGMDRRSINVLARMYMSTYDKVKSEEFNAQLMEFVAEDAAKNARDDSVIGRNDKEYVQISGTSENDEIRNMWGLLPNNIKMQYPHGFQVRRDLMHSVLGYRELSIADMPLLKELPAIAKNSMRLAERIWKEVVRNVKLDIVLKVPAVLYSNVISNFTYSVMTGYSPLKVAKLQLDGVRELNEFIRDMRELVQLEYKDKAGKATEKDKLRMKLLRADTKSSSVRELIDEGFYMSIVDDLSLQEFNAQNNVTDFIDRKLKGYPKFVQNGINLIYMNSNTKAYKFMNTATQYSDFVARYAQYHLMMKNGASKAEAIKVVRDAFINYNKPNSRFVEWLNQMGFVMFTKYFTRIQKALGTTAKTHPLKVLLAILGQEYVLGNIDDVYDQSVVSKHYGAIFHTPWEIALDVIHPHGVEIVRDAFNKITN